MVSKPQNDQQSITKRCFLGLLDDARLRTNLNSGLRVECLYYKVAWKLKILVLLVPDRAVTLQHFAAVDELIAALPLTSREFAIAQNRLRKAARYYRVGKLSLAAFELRLLGHSLQPRPVTERRNCRKESKEHIGVKASSEDAECTPILKKGR